MVKLIGAMAVVLLAFAGAVLLAGDLGGEVVLLTTSNEGGLSQTTKVWVVDDHKQIWIRSGQDSSAWFVQLKDQPRVTLERDGVRASYRAVVVPKQRERINRLMAERYGWADSLIGLVRDSSTTQPIRLDPVR